MGQNQRSYRTIIREAELLAMPPKEVAALLKERADLPKNTPNDPIDKDLDSSMTVFSVEMASGAHARAKPLTSAKILLTAIVWGFFGRPPGLPETPGLKLVERSPPRHCLSPPALLSVSGSPPNKPVLPLAFLSEMYLPLREQRVLAKRAREGIQMARPMRQHGVGASQRKHGFAGRMNVCRGSESPLLFLTIV